MRKRIVITLCFLFFIFICVWQHISVIRLGYEIGELQDRKRGVVDIHRELLIEVERFKSLDRIERIAISKLDMRRPEHDQVIIIKMGTYPLLKEEEDRVMLVRK